MTQHHEVPETAVCRACEYCLHGLAGGVCPECGTAFDPADPGTFVISREFRSCLRPRLLILCAVVLAYVAVCYGCTFSGQATAIRNYWLLGPLVLTDGGVPGLLLGGTVALLCLSFFAAYLVSIGRATIVFALSGIAIWHLAGCFLAFVRFAE